MKRLLELIWAFLIVVGMVATAQSEPSLSQSGSLLFGKNIDANLLYRPDSFRLAQNQTEFREVSVNESQAEPAQEGYTDEEIAEMINNPLGNLWMLFTQNDTRWISGDVLDRFNEDDKVFNTLMFMPVMPMQLTEDIKYIFRPVLPIHSFDIPTGFSFRPGRNYPPGPSLDWDRKNGLGDAVLWNAFSTNEGAKPPNIFGFGFTAMLPTATEDELGFDKWSAGPMALAFRITDEWILGTVYQHWWSFAGLDSADSVNLSDLQYVIRYRLTPETNIGIAPNIQYDWTKDSDDALTLPVGIGGDTLINIGPAPVKIGAEIYYYAVTPDAIGPEWQLRLIFTPVLPSPAWAKNAIF